MEHVPKIGAFVLETLTTGMYANPFDCLREYVQNAFDSILLGERQGVLKKNDGLITVGINPEKRSLVIKDNGVGISSSETIPRLLNVGMSSKSLQTDAGFRGIGRLAGIAYCKKLTFRTSALSEDECSVITFDCEGIRGSISPALKKVEELSSVIKKYTSQDLEEHKISDHFFEVRLEDVLPSGNDFLDMELLERYLSQVAPVEYDSQKFMFAPKIDKWAKENGLDIPYVKLVIKSKSPDIERQVFKPYKTHYKTKKNDFEIYIKDIGFYPETLKLDSSFWMWYSITDLLGMFNEDRVAGLRFRRNNIQIGGPERVAELFPGNEGRLNYWIMGEIHVIDDNIVPNARRDGFETNPACLDLFSAINPFIRQHCKECHAASSATHRPTKKLLSSAQSTITVVEGALQNGLSSSQEKESLLEKLEQESFRLGSALEMRKTPEEKKEVRAVLNKLNKIKEKLELEKNFTIKKIKTNIDRKQRKILREVMEIVNSTFTEVGCAKNKKCLELIKASILAKYQVQENDK